MRFRTISRINYLKRARHRRGFGIHSPFLFRLITTVVEGKRNNPEYKNFKQIKKEAINLLKVKMLPEIEGLFSQYNLPVSKSAKLYRKIELPLRYSKAVYRLIQYFQPANIFYFGPTLGVNLLIASLANPKSSVYHIDENTNLQRFAAELISKSNEMSINYLCEGPPQLVKADFCFVNHPYNPIVSRKIVQKRIDEHGIDDVLIIRGIHESKEMEDCWSELTTSTEVRVTLDLFEIGIALFRRGLQKENFTLKF